MSLAVRIARAYTKKDILLFCGYHGWHDWYLSANLSNKNALNDQHISGLEPLGVPSGLAGTNLPFHYNNIEEFEALMLTAKSFLDEREGLLALRLIRRGYHIDLAQIKEGLPPLKLTRIVKSVKYMLYWEFDTKENYGLAQKNLYDSYWKAIEKCLVVPHDKYLGEVIF